MRQVLGNALGAGKEITRILILCGFERRARWRTVNEGTVSCIRGSYMCPCFLFFALNLR